jgi:hypothetical protein
MFWLHKDLYRMTSYQSNISQYVQNAMAEDIAIYAQGNDAMALDNIVSAATYDLLHSMSGYLQKRY